MYRKFQVSTIRYMVKMAVQCDLVCLCHLFSLIFLSLWFISFCLWQLSCLWSTTSFFCCFFLSSFFYFCLIILVFNLPTPRKKNVHSRTTDWSAELLCQNYRISCLLCFYIYLWKIKIQNNNKKSKRRFANRCHQNYTFGWYSSITEFP